MSRYRVEIRVVLSVMAVFISSCSVVDLRPVIITTEPAAACTTLRSRDESLLVHFTSEPDRLQAERSFSVHSQAGVVEGDFLWDGNAFGWKPVVAWDPGVRYRMMMKGVVGMADGREARPEIDIPFFVVRSAARPCLASFYPSEGSSTGTAGVGLCAIHLLFSEQMDERTVEDAFSVRPSFKLEYRWNGEGTDFAIIAEESLEPCTVYRWTLGAAARSIDGSPVQRTETGSFITDIDSAPPRVESVYPAFLDEGTWSRSAESLDELSATDSIAVLFSEPVKPESARSGIRLQPNVSGFIEAGSPRLFIFSPERGWTPEQPLSLVVSADIIDESGLRSGAEYRASFTPSVPYLRVLRLSSDVGESLENPCTGETMPVTVGDPPEGKTSLTFYFSAAFDPAAKTDTVERLTLTPFFPGSLPGPSLRDVSWVSDDTLVMTWEGFRNSTDDIINYYKIIIPGGPGGVLSASGLRLLEDVEVYLEAKR